MDKTLDLDELERVAREALDDRGATSPRVAIPADDLLTLIAAARPAVVSDEVVVQMIHKHDAVARISDRYSAMRAALALLPGGVPDREAIAGVIGSYVVYDDKGGPDTEVLQDVIGGDYDESVRRVYELTDAIIAMLSGPAVPDGYVLVPREPTEAMVKSGQRAADDKYWLWRGLGERPVGSGLDGMALYVDAAYRAMLSASPKGSSQSQPCADGALPVLTETPHSAGKPDPNPEWEAKADAEHAAIREEVGECDPLATLTMLKTWKAHAEPADQDGRITFSRAMLDSAEDALEVALKLSSGGFVRGAQEAREMLARFVEQGGDAVIANSIRLNWNPSWGDDPGPPDRPDADTTERQPSPRDEQNPSASPKEVSQ